jgi:uncharacterized protein YjdB
MKNILMLSLLATVMIGCEEPSPTIDDGCRGFLTIEPANPSIGVGDSLLFTARPEPPHCATIYKKFVWTSSDTSVAAVTVKSDTTAYVKGYKNGSAIITTASDPQGAHGTTTVRIGIQ